MALSASESINSGLRTVVTAVLSATIPHRSTTTPKTKHTHRHASQWEKISYVVCIQGFHNSTDSVLLFLLLLLFCTDLSFCYWCHTLWNHKTRDRIWESCYSGSQILSCPSSIDSVAQYDGKMRQHQVGLSENKWQEECSGWFIEEWSTSSTRCCFDVLCDV